MKTKRRSPWADVREQIAGGTFPPVFITRDGSLGLDGQGMTLPKDIAELYPADILLKAAESRRAKLARDHEQHLADVALRAEHDDKQAAFIATNHTRLAWRFHGFYVEELSPVYTYDQLRKWIDCYAYTFRHNSARFSVSCEREGAEPWYLDVSDHFANPCNDRRRTPPFAELLDSLATFTAGQSARAD